ncbi:MAG: nucleoside triphosphate pyrophosphohydrolase [Myxococcota bacterium]
MDRFQQAGNAFAELCRTMAKLRAPGGCAWDHEQTFESLKQYLIEEAYETIDAIDSGDANNHCEELGDVLLQVVFQAEIAHESSIFDVTKVAKGINDKLIRRHPHVFGDTKTQGAREALASWEAMKAQERPARTSCLDGIPRALPALLRAQRSSDKAAGIGFDWPDVRGVRDKVEEELRELWDVVDEPTAHNKQREELGDLLFTLVNLARHLEVDPEAALSLATDKFHRRFRQIEKFLSAKKLDGIQVSLDELEQLWEDAKRAEAAKQP